MIQCVTPCFQLRFGAWRHPNRSCGQSWWTTPELLVEFDSFYFGCFKFRTRPSGGSFCSTSPPLPIDQLLSWKPNGRTLRNRCESELGGRAKVPSEAAESGAAARACPSRRVVKTLDAFCPLCLWSRVTWSSLLAGNKWRCPAPPQDLCAGNWTVAIVIIWILCRLTPTSIQILLYSPAAGYRLLPFASPPVAAVPETCEGKQDGGRSRVQRPPSGTRGLLFPVLSRSDVFQDRMSPVRTPVPRACVTVWVMTTFHPSHTSPCYIQNAVLLTFMPPFISIYMYMFELYISQLHPYEKYREKAKHRLYI